MGVNDPNLTDPGTPGAAAARAGPEQPWARALLSGLLAFLVGSVLLWNLPESRGRALVLPIVKPLMLGLGLQQDWGLFSPDPPGGSVFVDVVVRRADGSDARITLPGSDPWLGALRDYRWRKWSRRMSEKRRQHLWNATARWFARKHGPAQAVILHRRTSPTPEPGTGAARRWKTFPFFELSEPAREAP